MAHMIDSMAFVGKLPWHELGTKLDNIATADEMRVAAGLDWPVQTESVFDADMNELKGFKLTRRMDTQAVLGIVSNDYVPFQNADAFRMADAITMDPNGPKYETAGSLSGGERVWALARIPDWFEVLPGDAFGSYLLISTGHDGKNALRIMLTNIRVVCNNTLTAATRDENRGVRFSHNGDILTKADDVRAQLGLYHKQALESLELYRHLANINVKQDDIDIVLKALFGEKGQDAKRDRSGAKRAEVLRLMEEGYGTDIKGVRGTAWGLWNAVAEYCDHVHGASGVALNANDKRLESMWFGGTIQTRKEAALELLVTR